MKEGPSVFIAAMQERRYRAITPIYGARAEAFLSFIWATTGSVRSQDELAEIFQSLLKWNPTFGYHEELVKWVDSLPWKPHPFRAGAEYIEYSPSRPEGTKAKEGTKEDTST